jgi:hypothetical protein
MEVAYDAEVPNFQFAWNEDDLIEEDLEKQQDEANDPDEEELPLPPVVFWRCRQVFAMHEVNIVDELVPHVEIVVEHDLYISA